MPWDTFASITVGLVLFLLAARARGFARRRKESTLTYIRAAMRFVKDVQDFIFRQVVAVGDTPMPPVLHEEKLAAVDDLVAKAEEMAGLARAWPPGQRLTAAEGYERAKVVNGIGLLMDQMPAAIAAAKGCHGWCSTLKAEDVDGLLREWRAMQQPG